MTARAVAIGLCLVLAAAGLVMLGVALYHEEARREGRWRALRPSCRLLTVVAGEAFGPPQAIYECPGGLLVKRSVR